VNGPTTPAHLGDALSALADGELDAAEAAAAQDHLSSCAECAAELALITQARTLVRNLPTLDPPRPLVLGRLQPVPPRRWAAPAAAAAAAVAMALLAAVGGDVARDPAPMGRLVQVHATSAVNADPVSQLAPSAIPISFTGP